MSLSNFFPEEKTEYSLVVANLTEPKEFQNMFKNIFKNQTIDVTQIDTNKYDSDTVLLLKNNEVISTSSFTSLENSVLLINSDLYKTGSRLGKVNIPDVIKNLDEVPFLVKGYPLDHKEKLLLIIISRYIEQLAWNNTQGTLRSGFQKFSRLDDERGTLRAYKNISETKVDTHIYGVPDKIPNINSIKLHGGYTDNFRNIWFVVYVPNSGNDEHMALLARLLNTGTWEGFWTYEKQKVLEINQYIEKNM